MKIICFHDVCDFRWKWLENDWQIDYSKFKHITPTPEGLETILDIISWSIE